MDPQVLTVVLSVMAGIAFAVMTRLKAESHTKLIGQASLGLFFGIVMGLVIMDITELVLHVKHSTTTEMTEHKE